MVWVDYVIIGIVAVSAVISLIRGFVREAISLLGWILAIWAALGFSASLSPFFARFIEVPSLRELAAFLVIFLGVLFVAGVTNFILGLLVEKTGMSGTDRVLGMVFGAARGVLIVALLVVLAGFTKLPADPWWRASILIPHFAQVAEGVRDLLPPELAKKLGY